MTMSNFRRWAAVGVLGGYAISEGYAAWFSAGWLRLVFTVFGAALLVAMVGVRYQRAWARWLALGAGITGLSNVLMLVAVRNYLNVELAAFTALPVALLLTLGGRRMAEHFTAGLSEHSAWRRLDDPRMQVLAGAIVAGFSSIAMLLLFSAVAWTHEALFLAVAALSGMGIILAARERAAGVIFLAAGAVGAGGIAYEMADLAHANNICFTPLRGVALIGYPGIALGAVLGLAALVAFARPMLRFVRSTPLGR
jgi:hypothetical protein